MLGANLLDGFELVKVSSSTRTTGAIKISKDKKQMNISAKFINELGWQDKQRVNLRCKGTLFALEPSKVGLVTIHIPKSSGGLITSQNFCWEVLSRSKSCREFEGWVEGDTLFFKPKKGEE